jgi:hypothetical protein
MQRRHRVARYSISSCTQSRTTGSFHASEVFSLSSLYLNESQEMSIVREQINNAFANLGLAPAADADGMPFRPPALTPSCSCSFWAGRVIAREVKLTCVRCTALPGRWRLRSRLKRGAHEL